MEKVSYIRCRQRDLSLGITVQHQNVSLIMPNSDFCVGYLSVMTDSLSKLASALLKLTSSMLRLRSIKVEDWPIKIVGSVII